MNTNDQVIVKKEFYNLDANKFWSFVDKKGPDECWFWTGQHDRTNYGTFTCNGSSLKAHRISFVLHKGEVPDGLIVTHSCQNRNCINPNHLFAITKKEHSNNLVKLGICPTGDRHWCATNPEKVNKGEKHWMIKNPKLAAEKMGGENNSSAKLNKEQVLEIRKLHATGNYEYKQLGIQFGVAGNTIRNICIRKTWPHI